MERTILHSDLNNFFASVECMLNPRLRGRPVAVAGDPEKRHGIVLAKNCEAKRFNVSTGEPLWKARQKCPEIIFTAPHYEKYSEISDGVKKIYSEYTDFVEPFGIDECWLDVTGVSKFFGGGKSIADEIRLRVKKEFGVTVSVGVSFNKIFAKLGSDMKKPDAVTVIRKENFMEIIGDLYVGDLLYVGRKTAEKLSGYGIDTIKKLAGTSLEVMRLIMGKNGEMLWSFANGLDVSPVANISVVQQLKSVSCGNTAPRDLVNDEEVCAALYPLAEKVSERLRKYGCICKTVCLGVRDNNLRSYERQKKMIVPGRTSAEIFRIAHELFLKNYRSGIPVRSLSIRASDLIYNGEQQLTLDPEISKIQRLEFLESAIDSLGKKYGRNMVFRAACLKYPELANLHVHSNAECAVAGTGEIFR